MSTDERKRQTHTKEKCGQIKTNTVKSLLFMGEPNEQWNLGSKSTLIYWQMLATSDIDFLDKLHRVQMTILMTK